MFGDETLDHLAATLNNAIENQRENMYFTKNYEIELFAKDNQKGFPSNNFLIRIGNSFTTALNSAKIFLPSAVVIILTNQFLKQDFMADHGMPQMVERLLFTIHETVKARKKQLGNQYWEDHQPKIILLRPLPRPAYSLLDPQKYKTMRRLYSHHIERITQLYRVTLLNSDELNCSQRVLFDDFGNLSPYGIEKFWKSISDHFRRADRDEYYAVKMYRAPKRSQGTQTFTQSQTNQTQNQTAQNTHYYNWDNAHPAGDNNAQINNLHMPHHNPQPYHYQHGVNDHYHINHL